MMQNNDLINTTYTYDDASTRLMGIKTKKGLAILQNRTYTYSDAGDISSINDLKANKNYAYVYDDLHRLKTEAVNGAAASLTYSYNVIGNIATKVTVTIRSVLLKSSRSLK